MQKKINLILLFLLLIITYSCNPLVSFNASDCQHNNCKHGFSGLFWDGELLSIDYGTGSNCSTSFTGDVEYRNDSLILIADYINPKTRCVCGYSLTYIVKVEDTCDLKIGFEKRESKRYMRFKKRCHRQDERIKKVSEKRSEILEIKQAIRRSRFFDKEKELIKRQKLEIRDVRRSYRENRKIELIEKQRELEFQNYYNPQKKRVISDDVYY